MNKKGINRRQFLQTSGLATAGAAAAASGAVLVAPDGAWALELTSLSVHVGKTLLSMSRRIYPHDDLADMYYAGVVDALDGEAKGNADLARMLKDGVAELDAAKGVTWIDLSEGYQLEILTAMQDGGFFQKVRGTTIVALYNNPLVWRHFGYEGASFEFGGYLERGFDDVSWLPTPPEDASPKAG
jgi:hypothetical protein